MCVDATKYVVLSVFTAVETICTYIWAKAFPNLRMQEVHFPVDMSRLKTPLLRLAITF